MTPIHQHIHDLLQENECVIVPKIGGIINSSFKGASNFKLASGPGTMGLSFNPLLNFNDGLLANQIVKEEKLSYIEALQEIDKYVSEIQKELASDRRFTIDQVGVLFKDADNIIQIEPLNDQIIVREAASLSKTLAEYVSDDMTEFQPDEQPGSASSSIPEHDREKSISKRRSVFIVLFAFLAGITLSICVYIYFSGNRKTDSSTVTSSSDNTKVSEENSASELQSTEILPVIEKGTDGRSPVTDKNRFVSNAKSSVVTESGSIATNHKYFIVAGSFKSLENAEIKLAGLKFEGFNDAIIISRDDKPHLVCFDAYETEKDAEDGLILIKVNHKDAWVFTY